jgi:dipeptidyl aminopeptidase/acylaminoacyl peptidase
LNLFTVALDGGPLERLTMSENLQLPGSWSPDGRTLAFVEQRPGTGRDIWLLRPGQDPIVWADSAAEESAPRFSPDGRAIAYVSDRSGRAEVYVRGLESAAPGSQISADGGMEPVWSRDGRQLFYRNAGRLITVAVRSIEPFRAGDAREAFPAPVEAGSFDSANYDVFSTTGRFIAVAGASAAPPLSTLRVVLNWTASSAPSP